MESQNMFGTQAGANAENADDAKMIGRQVLEPAGIGPSLPQRLLVKPDSRPCAPLQLSFLPKNAQPATLAQQAEYLATQQPVGGHEQVVAANQQAVLTRAKNALTDALSAGDAEAPFAEIVRQTRDTAVDLRGMFDAELRAFDERREKAAAVLRKYQDGAAKAAGGSTGLFDIVGKLLGGYVKVTEAIRAFNDREMLSMQCDAHRGALEVMAQIITMCERLLAGLETTRAAAMSGALEALQRTEAVTRELQARGRIADYMVDPERALASASHEDSPATYLPELIGEARDNGGANLTNAARGIATRVVAIQLGPLGLIDLLRREAANTTNAKGLDPARAPLLVAARVLDLARRRRPSVRLTDDSHPREFVLQISSDARPLFTHPSLIAARFRRPRNEFAFVRVQTDVALDELQVMREGEKEFGEALQRREFFIVEEIAQAWQSRAGVADSQDRDTPLGASNQHHETSPSLDLSLMPSPNGNVS